MNLELDPAQLRLADVVRKAAEAAPVDADGWLVLDSLGITDLLAPAPPDEPLLGHLEWSLIFEELGAAGRDPACLRDVRAFLDAVQSQDAAARGRAAAAFGDWAHRRRTAGGTCPQLPPVRGDVGGDPPADRDLMAGAAYGVGIARRCLELARERAGDRLVAGRRLIELQGTAHRLAEAAVELMVARIAVRAAAFGEDGGRPAGPEAPAAAAAAVSAALSSTHLLVQVFGAAGTSLPQVTALYRAAYELPAWCGSARSLWDRAGRRWLGSAELD